MEAEADVAGKEEEEEEERAKKAMRDHADLDSQTKKPSGFWSAASVFSKKLQKWRQKQKNKKRDRNGVVGGVVGGSGTLLPVEKSISWRRFCTAATVAEGEVARREGWREEGEK